MAIGHDLLRNEIGSISDKINLKIFAESKGALRWGEHLPLGMVGEKTQGMLLCFPVCILGMGLSSTRRASDVTVALLVNNVEIPKCSVSLANNRSRKHGNFDIPFEVTEGSVINLVSKTNSSDTQCTTVSFIIKIN